MSRPCQGGRLPVWTPCQDLTRPRVSAPGRGQADDLHAVTVGARPSTVVGTARHGTREGRIQGCPSAPPPRSSRSSTSSTSSARRSSSRRPGTTYKGLCPFHGEKTPIVRGDARARDLEVLRLRPGRGHLQLRHGARRGGLPGRRCARWPAAPAWRSQRADDPRGRPAQAPARRPRGRHRLLPPGADHPHRRRSRRSTTCTRRGFTDDDHQHLPAGLRAGRLGRADQRADAQAQHPRGGPEGAGLVEPPARGRGVYDRFRGRVIFPIRDASGDATGLGGRILGPQTERRSGPKYLNSPRRCSSTRAARSTSSTGPRRPSAAPAAPSSWRATRTP